MKYYPLIIILLVTSCQKRLRPDNKTEKISSIDKAYKLKVQNSINNQFRYPNGSEVPNDTIIYNKLLKRKKSHECSRLLSYSKSNVKLLSLNEKHTDYKLNEYNSCEAMLYGDTIEITLRCSPFGGGEIIYFASIPINIIIIKDQFELDLTHTSDVVSIAKQANGKYERVPFPKSEIEVAKLTVNKNVYEVGDTIKGILYARSIFREKHYRKNVKNDKFEMFEKNKNEIIKGSFRAILEDRKNKCFK